MAKGYLAIVLHAHLPYVRHPESEQVLEEKWFYEAVTEAYIPLLEVFNRLAADNIPYRLTFSVSPTLLSMLTDPLMQRRYVHHLAKLIELAGKEESRTYGSVFHPVALMYKEKFRRAYDFFVNRYGGNLARAFQDLQRQGCLEIITCAATHGFLPLMMVNKQAVRAQIETAVNLHSKHFGAEPKGFWLPECGYAQGMEDILQEYGIKYFITDNHGVLFAQHRPRFGNFAPIYCPNGIAVFGRDVESSKQVWSADEGYPGDPDYREFYRDIGYDLEEAYIKDYIHPAGFRTHTGLKYYRITGKVDLADKKPYRPDWAQHKAAIHAGNFMFNREKQVAYLASLMERPPIIVAPYDAELFGHWWFEGPIWLDLLIRQIFTTGSDLQLITLGDYLRLHPRNQVTRPCPSTWGNAGYNQVWLNEKNHWIYRHLHMAADRMTELADLYPRATGLLRRALNQAGRELLLAQSSDWAFIIATGTMVPYAIERTKQHIANFLKLYHAVKSGCLEEDFIFYLEWQNNIFPNIDYRSWRTRAEPYRQVVS
ncbi:glycoside hydrolase family 57 protein [Desulforamulus hydrothermalis]|uniref:Glycoside hydrolase family 57 n=1 Tax=Desulforamulus hydrothermalis Lam5 = DSM 18033 TaxID=1121428 RepID=K8E0Z5_9FIRM|nr:1,4-alpha-glucan branching protein domain-containing protein [Desulforamulus hydrothermalis]CCO09270.1 conserved hypothetical protein [Desulforamulus hydrothermalis Lam5 = DSM 18033]SHH05237.1 1,4-alpha-glucan branching enzyme [Desulforamulus hydrothermalis Lam5 = DSM 18033]